MSARKASYNLREEDDDDKKDEIKTVKLKTAKTNEKVSWLTSVFSSMFCLFIALISHGPFVIS